MQLLEKLYQKTISNATSEFGTGNGMDIWQWDEGVCMYGLSKAYDKTGDKKILDFMKLWIDTHIERMDFGLSINTTAPLLGVLKLLEVCGENKVYYDLCKRFADWCVAEAPRADLGAFEHSCTVNKYPNQIWADTLFMGCLFLVKWGLYTKQSLYIKEAIRQFRLHYYFLKDAETGLIYHGYYCNEREQKGVLWGRGNCWFSLASVEVLSLLDGTYEGYDELLDNFLKHTKGVLEAQHQSGAWHTVMNRSDTYLEFSATAAFAYSLKQATELGYINADTAAQKALDALKDDISDDGSVQNGSLGTCIMQDYLEYNKIGVGFSYFTQGLAMMALSIDN